MGRAAEYPWSSARAHVEGVGKDPYVNMWDWDELGLGADWSMVLEQREQDAAELRAATYAGLPCGEAEFVEQMERTVERPLRRLKPGRKPKAVAASEP